MQSADNFTAKLSMIRQRLDQIKHRQAEHFRQFKRLQKVNMYCNAVINVLNTISVTSIVFTFSGSNMTLIVCAVSNTLSAVGTAILSVISVESKSHSHQRSYLQFVELHDTYIAELLHDNLNGVDLDRILADLNSKVALILDTCEPIEPPKNHSPRPISDEQTAVRKLVLKQPMEPSQSQNAQRFIFQSPSDIHSYRSQVVPYNLHSFVDIPTSPTSTCMGTPLGTAPFGLNSIQVPRTRVSYNQQQTGSPIGSDPTNDIPITVSIQSD
jgi:hypothetical protein